LRTDKYERAKLMEHYLFFQKPVSGRIYSDRFTELFLLVLGHNKNGVAAWN